MLLMAWLSCTFVVHDCPHCDGFSCADVAMHDADGRLDPCDLEACERCVDSCDGDCLILESYPPRYTCESASWDVYTTCPDWTPQPSPAVTDLEDLGCGADEGEVLTAVARQPGRVEVTHLDYALGCCPEQVQVELAVGEDTLTVAYTLVDDFCDCACMLDVSYTLVEVPAGTWQLVAGGSQVTTSVTVP
jgi:hypothetical protein